jgi:filamentous hemagglutinin
MAPAHLELLSEAVVGLLSAPGMASAAYELITGTTVVSKDEANYFFAALGIIPGTQLAKGVSKAGELVQVLADPGKVNAIRQIALNQAKGMSLEKSVLQYLGISKNTTSFTANVNGRLVTVIPDGVMDGDKILEIKNVMNLSNSDQLRAYAALSEAGGTIKKGAGSANGSLVQFKRIDLIVSPETKISMELELMITKSGGSIQVFNVAEQTLKPWAD